MTAPNEKVINLTKHSSQQVLEWLLKDLEWLKGFNAIDPNTQLAAKISAMSHKVKRIKDHPPEAQIVLASTICPHTLARIPEGDTDGETS